MKGEPPILASLRNCYGRLYFTKEHCPFETVVCLLPAVISLGLQMHPLFLFAGRCCRANRNTLPLSQA